MTVLSLITSVLAWIGLECFGCLDWIGTTTDGEINFNDDEIECENDREDTPQLHNYFINL